MNFDVRVPKSIEETIDSWPFTPHEKATIYDKALSRLSSEPVHKIGKRIVAPIRGFLMHFNFQSDANGLDVRVTLVVNDVQERGVRIIVGASYRDINSPSPFAI